MDKLYRNGCIKWTNEVWLPVPAEIVNDYELIRPLGEGTYGKVFVAEVKKPGLPGYGADCVAIKFLSLIRKSEGVPPTTMREMALLVELDHPNIVKLHNIHVGAQCIALVFEMCEAELGHVLDLHIKTDDYLSRSYVRSIIFQLLLGVDFCHNEGILHRDIKPQNVLMTGKYTKVKLADFGLARTFGFSPLHEQKNCTAITLWYRPPELLLGNTYYSTAAEVWSIGCLLGELLATRTLLAGSSESDQLRRIFSLLDVPDNIHEIFPEIKDLAFLQGPINRPGPRLRSLLGLIMDQFAADLLLKMLAINPAERITVTDALRHPFIADQIAAPIVQEFVPSVTPSYFHLKLNELVPPLDNSSRKNQTTPPSVETLYLAHVRRMARDGAERSATSEWARRSGDDQSSNDQPLPPLPANHPNSIGG